MKLFQNLSIGNRLGAGFGLLLLFIFMIGVIGVTGMNELDGKVNNIVLYNNAKNSFAVEMNSAIRQRENGILALLLASNSAQQQEIADKVKWQVTQYEDAKKGLAEILAVTGASESESKIIAKIEGDEAEISPLLSRAMDIALAEKTDEALKIYNDEINPVIRNWLGDVSELESIEQRLNDEASVEANASFSRVRNITVAGVVLAILLGAFLSFSITRSIKKPLNEAIAVAQLVASGDLSGHIEVKRKDETGMLLQALKDMNESLTGIVGEVRGATDSIATGAKQIAAGNSDLSQRTEEQASSLEETASSMEELTSTVKQNADNARQANQMAANASDVAVKGGQVVGEVVQTMASISDSSKKIVDIISVIEGIAFQTNILALNAAVEAARAGEQGRGFAVVASEVRNLAQRSAAAAKEIKTLIGDSVDKVNAGSKLVDQAGATMSEIVSAVKRVTDIMSEIAAASNQQSAGIEQVNQAITQMDEVTQQNAALVEEAAAAAESMEEQANSLMQAVSVFKLDSAQAKTRTVPARPAIAQSDTTEAEPVRYRKHLSAKPKDRKLVSAKEENDGEWKEF